MRVTRAVALVAAFAAAMTIGSGLALRLSQPATTPTEPSPFASSPSTLGWSAWLEAPRAPVADAKATGRGSGAVHAVDAMRADFIQSSSLAALFERGLRNPSSGGLFFARLAFRQCLMLGRSPNADASSRTPDPLGPARARCGTLGDTASRERLDATMQTATARLDPALSIVNDLDDRSKVARLTPTDVQRAIDASIALGDPYVLRNVMLRGVPRLEAFDGRPIDPELRGDLMMAMRLASCDLGIDCPREARVLLTCARQDGCPNTLMAMGVGDASMSDDRRRTLNDLAVRIGDAARDGTLAGLFK